MLLKAADDLQIDLAYSYLVGDKGADIGAVHRVGGKGILVLTGYGTEERGGCQGDPPDFVARDLLEAAYWVLIQEGAKRRHEMAIKKELLDILACPKCKGDLVLTKKGDGLICKACKVIYPIKDDIPVMLIDEALPYKEKRLTEVAVSFPDGRRSASWRGSYSGVKGKTKAGGSYCATPIPSTAAICITMWSRLLQRSLAREGFSTLRFNFRGVGGSRGEYGEGAAEVKDVRGAVDFIAREAGADHDCYLLGYSFGAYVGVHGVTADSQVKAIVCISPPVALYDFGVLKEEKRPKLIVSGQRDLICPVLPVEELFASLPEPKTMHICAGADHFWWGMEAHVTDYVFDFFQGL